MQLADPNRFAELSGIRDRDLSEGEATLTLKKPPDDYASVATCPLCCDTLDTWVSVASVEWPDQSQNLKGLLVHVECTPRMPSELKSEPPLTPITGTGVANSTQADDTLSASSGARPLRPLRQDRLRPSDGARDPSRHREHRIRTHQTTGENDDLSYASDALFMSVHIEGVRCMRMHYIVLLFQIYAKRSWQ